MHMYEVRLRVDKRGFDLISDTLRLAGFGMAAWKTRSVMQSFTALTCDGRPRIDESDPLIETHESEGAFREP
jgi:hypothetical protein